MNNFLNDLKNAVDKGEFNSEAVKKINEIDKLATENFSSADEAKNAVDKRLEQAGVKTFTDEELGEIDSSAEKKMLDIEMTNIANKQLAMLIEIEDLVKASIEDMLLSVEEIEEKFSEELEKENPAFADLSLKIEDIKNKYISK